MDEAKSAFMAITIVQPTLSTDHHVLLLSGDWTTAQSARLAEIIQTFLKLTSAPMIASIDAKHIDHIDTSGAWYLYQLKQRLLNKQSGSKELPVDNLSPKAQALYDEVIALTERVKHDPVIAKPAKLSMLAQVGKRFMQAIVQAVNFLVFLGAALVRGIWMRSGRRDWSWKGVIAIVEQMGIMAIPIVGLLNFLIGVVLCYQMGLQLIQYNANIFIVDLTGLAMLREFGPLITALIAAARTSTAFSSEIGSMKVNQELDALTTMGISPLSRLVIPKVIGLLIALPLLTIWADAMGVFGSMIMSKSLLSINYADFANRFRQVVEMSSFWLGLAKAPAFALAIAFVGCFQGFRVRFGADSVGRHTTRAAVQSIFLIIIIDAAYSILYSMQGW
jgi:phospholipid/cholesterol/gamma-HCH transport system permease protein